MSGTDRGLRIGTRGSTLARWQAERVRARLERAHAGLRIEIIVVRTTGDRITDAPLAAIGDRGLFTAEIDRHVLDGGLDLAVHSLKDLPTIVVPGLAVGAVLEREDPTDALVTAPQRPASLEALPPGARIGTSSLRRRALILHRRPDLLVEDLRGNLETRLARIARGDFDATVLAFAGLRRLEKHSAVAQRLEPPDWLPAAGQGALGLVVRAEDRRAKALLEPLDEPDVRAATTAERAFLRALEGGCQVPIGALAGVADGRLRLAGFVADLDGRRLLRGEADGSPDSGNHVGRRLADQLLDRGAGDILDTVRRRVEPPPPASPP